MQLPGERVQRQRRRRVGLDQTGPSGAAEGGQVGRADMADGALDVAVLGDDDGAGHDHRRQLAGVGGPLGGRDKEAFGLLTPSGHGLGDGGQHRQVPSGSSVLGSFGAGQRMFRQAQIDQQRTS
ncbi:hypothetical protein ACFWIY_10885 [Streptomyces sioyaensis]|uniref:hypothetical protein n=1 Tax=Streptomyces sioyaensis TaxID=67364 RepID=UPI003646CCD4